MKYNQHLRKRLTAEDENRKDRILMKKINSDCAARIAEMHKEIRFFLNYNSKNQITITPQEKIGKSGISFIMILVCRQCTNEKIERLGQSHPAVNNRLSINYNGKRQSLTLTIYSHGI